jgi:hypothetical protein
MAVAKRDIYLNSALASPIGDPLSESIRVAILNHLDLRYRKIVIPNGRRPDQAVIEEQEQGGFAQAIYAGHQMQPRNKIVVETRLRRRARIEAITFYRD